MLERKMKKGFTSPMRRLRAIVLVVATGAFCAAAQATEIHSWVDENGVRHFSDIKPVGTESQLIEIRGGTPTGYSTDDPDAPQALPRADDQPPLTAAQQRRREIAESRMAQNEERAFVEAECRRHRYRLEQMEPARGVLYVDENGRDVRMDNAERLALVEESRDYLAENCH